MANGRYGAVDNENEWTRMLTDEQWAIYGDVIREARVRGLRFAIGGGFAVAAYTDQCRNTKDLDLYILPAQREAMIALIQDLGLGDYFEKVPYDRAWIYRSYRGEVIVDIIWAMANGRSEVDEAWLTRGPVVDLKGQSLSLIPAEEMIWDKLHVLQRDRCDWPDVLNLIYARGPQLDWEHLLERMEQELPLLQGGLYVFSWIAPGRAAEFPAWIWSRLRLPTPGRGPHADRRHVDLLDRRPWFAPVTRRECLPPRA